MRYGKGMGTGNEASIQCQGSASTHKQHRALSAEQGLLCRQQIARVAVYW